MKLWIIHSFFRLLSWLPLSLSQKLGSMAGQLSWLKQGRSAKVTLKNLSLCMPELANDERRALAQQSLRDKGKTLMEMGKVWVGNAQKILSKVVSIDDQAGLEQLKQSDKGLIIIAPHLGNWELLNLYMSQYFTLNVLYAPPKIPELDLLIQNARVRTGAKVFATDRKGVLALFQGLCNGEGVGILPDQEPPAGAGTYAPFFGVEAHTMNLVSKLAQKTRPNVIFAFAKRVGDGFEIVVRPAEAALYSENMLESVSALNRGVEALVREAPSQYQWEYKRFRTCSNGKTSYYRFK